jgi:hypothetical protein
MAFLGTYETKMFQQLFLYDLLSSNQQEWRKIKMNFENVKEANTATKLKVKSKDKMKLEFNDNAYIGINTKSFKRSFKSLIGHYINDGHLSKV